MIEMNGRNDDTVVIINKKDCTDDDNVASKECCSPLALISNALFHHYSPFGKTIVLPGWQAFAYLCIIFAVTGSTFGLLMWYFTTKACVPSSIALPGIQLQESISATVLNTPGYHTCLTLGIQTEFIDCCLIKNVEYYTTESICSIYSAEANRCFPITLDCFPEENGFYSYPTIVAQLMICPNSKAIFVDSFQYSMLAGTIITLLFFAFKMVSERKLALCFLLSTGLKQCRDTIVGNRR